MHAIPFTDPAWFLEQGSNYTIGYFEGMYLKKRCVLIILMCFVLIRGHIKRKQEIYNNFLIVSPLTALNSF